MSDWVGFLNTILPIFDLSGKPSNVASLLIIAIIIFFTAINLRSFIKECKECIKGLSESKNYINQYSPENISINYEKLSKEMSFNKIIGYLWQEYDKTLVKSKGIDNLDKVYSTVDADYFFNESNIIASRMNVQFYNAIPGILTGLGILGTFIGLTIGLAQIQLGVDDVQVLKKGIVGLLLGVGTAFSTSLWGILLSIVFNILSKNRFNIIKNNIYELNKSVDNLFVRKTPENILNEMLEESRQQTRELKSFNTELAISIADALDEKLAGRLAPSFEKLLSAIEESSNSGAEKFAGQLEPSLNKLLSAIDQLSNAGTSTIAETIIEGAGKEIADLGRVLNQVQSTLENTVNDSHVMQERMAESLSKHIKAMSDSVNSLLDNVAFNQQAINDSTQEKIHQILSKIEENIIRQQQRIEETTAKAGNELLQQVENVLSQVKDKLNDTVSNSENIQSRMNESLNNYVKATTDALNHLMQSMVSSQQELNGETQDRMQKLLAQMEDSLSRQQSRVEESTTRAGNEFVQQIGNMSSEISNILAKFGKQTGESVDDIRTQVKEMSERVRGILDEVSERYQYERAQLSTVLEKLTVSLKQIDTVIASAGQAAAVFGDAAYPVKESGIELRKVSSELHSFLNSYTDIVTVSHEQMDKYNQFTAQSLENIGIALEKTQSAWMAYENRFGIIKGDLESIFEEIAKGLREYRHVTGDGVKGFLNDLDNYLSKITGLLAGAIDDLSVTVKDLDGTVSNLRNH